MGCFGSSCSFQISNFRCSSASIGADCVCRSSSRSVNQRLSCVKMTFAGGPPNSSHANQLPNTTYGTYGRFRYFPGLDVFVLVNDWNIPAYILRLR